MPNGSTIILSVTFTIASLAAVATWTLMVYAGDFSTPWEWLFGVGLAIWSATPYAALSVLAYRLRTGTIASVHTMIGLIAIAAFNLSFLYDGFFVHLDAQNGLLFIFLPVYQLVGAAFIAVIGTIIWKREVALSPVAGRAR